jgi:hypothetical protein
MLKTLPWRMMAFGCALGVLAGLLVVAFESDFPDFQGRRCEYNQATKHEDCATYTFFPFLLIQISKTLNDYGVAITALATVAISIFTLTLKLSTDKLSTATNETIRLTKEAFIAANRPKLIVRELRMLPQNHNTTMATVEVSYVVANTGASEAEIVDSWIEIQDVRYGLLPLHSIEENNPIGKIVIKGGANVSRTQSSSVGHVSLQIGRMSAQRLQHEPPELVFRGFITYLDQNQITRRTGFYRRYNFKTMRFCIIDDPDYEYAD